MSWTRLVCSFFEPHESSLLQKEREELQEEVKALLRKHDMDNTGSLDVSILIHIAHPGRPGPCIYL